MTSRSYHAASVSKACSAALENIEKRRVEAYEEEVKGTLESLREYRKSRTRFSISNFFWYGDFFPKKYVEPTREDAIEVMKVRDDGMFSTTPHDRILNRLFKKDVSRLKEIKVQADDLTNVENEFMTVSNEDRLLLEKWS